MGGWSPLHQRRRRHRARRAVLRASLHVRGTRRPRRCDRAVPAHRGCRRRADQGARVDLGCRRRLPGRGGVGCRDGRRGLAEVLGGSPAQVENAAGSRWNTALGLTCDPIGGLVQIPCIERNAISAGRAINAARMALRGDGTHRVSLDQVIATMRDTGRDMHSKYKGRPQRADLPCTCRSISSNADYRQVS